MARAYLHYKIIEKLGEGGMGVVYLAEDTKLQRKVALKFLPSHISSSNEERKRFEQEARSAAALNHPYIAHVYAIEEVDGEMFIVMEYVNGRDLGDVIEEDSLSMDDKISIAEQIAKGIKAAHDAGIIHRDIKSRNIMINHEGTVKIMDFGLAHIQGTDHITKTGTTIGTTSYMSPEQLKGGAVDEQTDIWSYGVVLYELFAEDMPFKGMYEPAILYSITEEQPTPVHELNPEVPKKISDIINKCLEKDKQDRYPDLNEVLSDFSGESAKGEQGLPFSKKWIQSDFFQPSYLSVTVLVIIISMVIYFASGYDFNSSKPSNVPDKKHMAVLPIENIDDDPELHSIGRGLTEIFSYRLSELEKSSESFWVIPTSEIRSKNIKSASEANKQFGVNLAILSSLYTSNDSTSLIIELVNANDLRRIDAKQITVASDNLMGLEKGGIQAILGMLRIKLLGDENEKFVTTSNMRSEAYKFYLKGLSNLQSYSNTDSLTKAINYFEQSVGLEPEFSLSYAGLGEAYWRRYQNTQEPELIERARNSLDKALQIDSSQAPVQTVLGHLMKETGSLDKALNHYKKALKIDPNYSNAYQGMADVYGKLGETEKAISIYQKAIELKPQYWGVYSDLGIFYFRNGDLDSALKYFKEVAELTPRNSKAYQRMGVVLQYMDSIDQAKQMYNKALALDNNPDAASNLATIYQEEGRYDEAASLYKIAAETSPDYYVYWGNLGSAYENAGDSTNAREAYLKAIEKAKKTLEIQKNDPEVMADLSAYYSDVNDKMNALSFIQKALQVAPENTYVQERAVFVYEALGLRSQALDHITPSIIAIIEDRPEFKELTKDPRFKNLKKKYSSTNQ